MIKISRILAFPFILLIKIYQIFISPILGSNCRYSPTCSQYGIIALKKYGILKGDRVYICSENRPEFFISDMGIMAAGGISVPAYTTNTSKDHEYIIKHSESLIRNAI